MSENTKKKVAERKEKVTSGRDIEAAAAVAASLGTKIVTTGHLDTMKNLEKGNMRKRGEPEAPRNPKIRRSPKTDEKRWQESFIPSSYPIFLSYQKTTKYPAKNILAPLLAFDSSQCQKVGSLIKC